MMPLTLAATGDRVQVVKVGGSSEQKKHLEDMGFIAGTQVEIVSTVGKGNLVVNVKGSRFALGKQIGIKVMVNQL